MLLMLRRVIPTLAIVVTAIPAYAHHSFGLYSEDVRELEGTLVDVDWRNPHVRLTLRVSSNSDAEALWTLEGAAGYILQRRGLERDLFQPGATLRVAGRPHARDSTLIWLHNVLLDSGEELLMIGGIEPRWTDESLGSDQELCHSEPPSLRSVCILPLAQRNCCRLKAASCGGISAGTWISSRKSGRQPASWAR